MNGTNLSSQKWKPSEEHIGLHWEEHRSFIIILLEGITVRHFHHHAHQGLRQIAHR